MSSGPFDDVFYESNLGLTYPARVQPETLGLTLGGVPNAQAAGPVTPGIPSARISGGRRSYGAFMRGVRVVVTAAGTSDLEAGSVITLPLLTPEAFNAAGRGATGTYNGATVRSLGTIPERIK